MIHAAALRTMADMLRERVQYRTWFEPSRDEANAEPELSVLEDLAALTAECGPWEAAIRMFNKINEEAPDVA